MKHILQVHYLINERSFYIRIFSALLLFLLQKLLKELLSKLNLSITSINRVFEYNTWLYSILLVYYQARMRAYFIESEKQVVPFNVSRLNNDE